MNASLKVGEKDVIARELPDFLAETDLEEAELLPELAIKEEMIEEVMQELYKEITCTAAPPSEAVVSELPPPSPASSSCLQLFVSGGKSENCGASVSDSGSSVMAGVEFASGAFGNGAEDEGLMKMDGCDGGDVGDEWLERVLEWAPLELEGWT